MDWLLLTFVRFRCSLVVRRPLSGVCFAFVAHAASGSHGHSHMERCIATGSPHVAGAAIQRQHAADAAEPGVLAAPLGLFPPVSAAPAEPHVHGAPAAAAQARPRGHALGRQVHELERAVARPQRRPPLSGLAVAGRQRQAADIAARFARRTLRGHAERRLRRSVAVAAHVQAALREQSTATRKQIKSR